MELYRDRLLNNSLYLQGIELILQALTKEYGMITEIKAPFFSLEEYKKSLEEIERNRGKSLFFPFLGSGAGNGALVELADGSVKWDFISGLGPYFFGHGNIEIWKIALEAVVEDTIFQGNLLPGSEVNEISDLLIQLAKPRISHCWLSLSGSMANDNALKVIRRKQFPAYKILAFDHCFAGRTCVMSEISDNPGHHKNQPVHGEVFYVPFYNPENPKSTEYSVSILKQYFHRYRGQIAAFMMELVQGEGGFRWAPKEFYEALILICKDEGIAIWFDEVQTFARTGEVFAFQKFGLDQYVDLVTCGKILQGSALLMSEEYVPQPGLLGGTFVGSTVGMKVALKSLKILLREGFFGKNGKITQLEQAVLQTLKELQKKFGKRVIPDYGAIGSMIYIDIFEGTYQQIEQCLLQCFQKGLIMFYCGHGPYRIRMLLPAGVLKIQQFQEAMSILEETLLEIKKNRG